MEGASTRRLRAGRRRRASAWSDRFVLFITTRATVQGRAGVGLRREAPACRGERRKFTRLNDDGSRPSSARFQLAPPISHLT